MSSDDVPAPIAAVVILIVLMGVLAVANHFYRVPQVDQAAAMREVASELRRLNDTLEKQLQAKEE